MTSDVEDRSGGFMSNFLVSIATVYATTALTWAGSQAYRAFAEGKIRSPLLWAAAGFSLGIALAVLAVVLRRRLRAKKPVTILFGVFSAAAVVAGLVISLNINPALAYRAAITPENLTGSRELTLPLDSGNLRLQVSGRWRGSFLYELEQQMGTAWEKLEIDGADSAKEIEGSRFYRIRPGAFMVRGTFRRGDVLRMNILNASSFEGTLNFELYGSTVQADRSEL